VCMRDNNKVAHTIQLGSLLHAVQVRRMKYRDAPNILTASD
jgi:hypothetical protein